MPKTGVLCIAFTFIGMIGKCQTQRTAIDASATTFSGCLKVKQFKCHKPSPKPLHFLHATDQISPKVHIKTGHPCSSVEPRAPQEYPRWFSRHAPASMWHPPWDQGLHVFFRWNNWWIKITWKIAMLSIVSRWYPIRLSIISCYLSCWLHNIQKIMIFRIGDTTGYPISKNRTRYWSLITWYLIVVFQPHKNNGIAGPLYKTVYKPIIGIGLRMLPENQKTTIVKWRNTSVILWWRSYSYIFRKLPNT